MKKRQSKTLQLLIRHRQSGERVYFPLPLDTDLESFRDRTESWRSFIVNLKKRICCSFECCHNTHGVSGSAQFGFLRSIFLLVIDVLVPQHDPDWQ